MKVIIETYVFLIPLIPIIVGNHVEIRNKNSQVDKNHKESRC